MRPKQQLLRPSQHLHGFYCSLAVIYSAEPYVTIPLEYVVSELSILTFDVINIIITDLFIKLFCQF